MVPTWVPTSESAAIELQNLPLRPRAEHGAADTPAQNQNAPPLEITVST